MFHHQAVWEAPRNIGTPRLPNGGSRVCLWSYVCRSPGRVRRHRSWCHPAISEILPILLRICWPSPSHTLPHYGSKYIVEIFNAENIRIQRNLSWHHCYKRPPVLKNQYPYTGKPVLTPLLQETTCLEKHITCIMPGRKIYTSICLNLSPETTCPRGPYFSGQFRVVRTEVLLYSTWFRHALACVLYKYIDS